MLPALLTVVGLALAGILWWMLAVPGAKPHVLPPPPPMAPATADTAEVPEGAATDAAPARSAVSPGAAATPAASPPGGQTLSFKFAGGSWAQVADARGHLLLDGLQPAGTSRSVSGAAPLRVVLGNASAVSLEVNGRGASLDAFVRRRGDAHFMMEAGGTLAADGVRAARGE